MGFDYFYGFMGGETDQWTPYLFRDHTQIFPWIGKPDYNLTTDMADEAIAHMRNLNAAAPDQPFFVYYVPGGSHSPHQPKKEWIEKFKGKFDMGWNAMREQIFANQKRLGVIPANAELTAWPDDLPKWETLSADEKKLFARQAEVYAGYTAYTDFEIGRVIQAVEDLGKLDNTLIIYIDGDNGTSPEGTLLGTPNQFTAYNGILKVPVEEQLRYYDVWGSAATYPHMAVAWSWAFDTPFKWTKQIASHFGGTRQGLAISWPARIKDAGGIRTQFHHILDIVPTILEATGIKAPQTVNGIKQSPIEGVSMAYTFDKANANVPSRHRTQYFEMLSVQGLYNDGWMLSGVPIRAPWQLDVKSILDPASAYKFELYDLSKDWTQYTDVAADNPVKVQEMKDLMFGEFAKYQVLPLDGSASSRFVTPRPSLAAGRKVFNYSGTPVSIAEGNQPSLLNTSYTITADIEVPQGGGDGVIVDEGGRFWGYGLYLLKGKPVFTYNLLDLKRTRWEGTDALTPGRHTIEYDFKYDGLGEATLAYNNTSGVGRGGTGTLKVDGTVVSTQKLDASLPLVKPLDVAFDIGLSSANPVDDHDYQVPFNFNGKINKVTIVLDPPKLTPEDVQKLEAAERSASD
jgi:arylsulfatase